MMAWRLLEVAAGELFVILQDEEDATEAEGLALLGDGEEAAARAGASRVFALVVTDGGALTPAQRGKLREQIDAGPLVTSVMIPSSLVRPGVRAQVWTNPVTRVFTPDEVDAWLAYLPLARAEILLVHGALAELQKKVRGRTWHLIEPWLRAATNLERRPRR